MSYELYNHTTIRSFKGDELMLKPFKGDELMLKPFKGDKLMRDEYCDGNHCGGPDEFNHKCDEIKLF